MSASLRCDGAFYIKKGDTLIRKFRFFLFMVIIGVACTALVGEAAVDWQLGTAIDIGQKPKDAVVSTSGDWIYVLTEAGDIFVYSSDGQLEDTIHAGEKISFISPGSADNQLLVGSEKGKSVRMLSIEFIHEIDISGSPALGDPDAPVVIAVFSDYQCPYCSRLMPMLEQVLEKYPGQVKVVFKQYPLKMHKAALSAAEAALVADREGRFRELHDLLHDDFRNMTEESILDKASSLGFDREAFREKMMSRDILMQIQKDMADGKKAGVSGIPSVFINGKRLKHRSLEGFRQVIDPEINKLGGQPATEEP